MKLNEIKTNSSLYTKSITIWIIFTCLVGFLQMTYVFEISHLKPYYFMAPSVVGLIFGALTAHIILLNRKLNWCATHDPLTQAFNHGHYHNVLNEWCNNNSSFSLILIDIDHFKNINDKFGHKFGDKALEHISNLIHKTKRIYDVFARHGGEEFAILAPRTDLTSASDIAHRICKVINTTSMPSGPTISCSIGVAQFRPGKDTADSLFERADKALYEAKSNGRNCVILEPS